MPGCTIGKGVSIVNSIIGKFSQKMYTKKLFLGPNVIITDGSQLPAKSIIGEGVRVSIEKSQARCPLIWQHFNKIF